MEKDQELSEEMARDVIKSDDTITFCCALLSTIENLEDGNMSPKLILEAAKMSIKMVVDGTYLPSIQEFIKKNGI